MRPKPGVRGTGSYEARRNRPHTYRARRNWPHSYRARRNWPHSYGARLHWLLCAGFALLLAVTTALPSHRIWGTCAAVAYAVAGLLTHGPWPRAAVAASLTGAVVVPSAVLLASGTAQSEVRVVERSGALLLHSGSPYLPNPAHVADYDPYLPGMALFGLPRALLGESPLTDARIGFCAVFLTCMFLTTVAARRDSVLPLAAFPAVALPLAVGGVDLPVLGLMCLGLALAGRGGSGIAAGAAMGAAAALKWTAWPLLPVGLALLTVTAGRRATVRATCTALLVSGLAVVPAALTDPHAFVEHVVLFPLGEGEVRSPAASPLPGHLLATYVPGGSVLSMAALAAAALAVAASLLIRPPRTVAAAAHRLALGLGLAMCLIPATRYGYLVYPLILATWFRRPHELRPVAAGPSPAAGASGAAEANWSAPALRTQGEPLPGKTSSLTPSSPAKLRAATADQIQGLSSRH
ncbi:glycosyltransferase 87 family protein [Streptomyces sp. NPDC007808]|uniref:glycosyltransferase 87 family protein n=1 Tax=Streptomyces sp. NPDC007808 TaxID=3364779 RepID=UPI0036A758C8